VKHLVLVGLMGAGKTTVGQMCAARLGRAFVDTDDLVETLAHASVGEIFASVGEARFRELEQQAVAEACASPEPLVIACGGGAVLAPESRRLLRAAGTVVWLRAPTSVLRDRVGDGSGRPLLASGTDSNLERLAGLREGAYSAAAHASVDTEDLDPDGVVDAVLSLWEEALR